MRTELIVNAEHREGQGKAANRRLRRAGKVPGIVYGAGKGPTAIAVEQSELLQQLQHEAFYSQVLSLQLDGQSESVVLRDLQRHPAKPLILHMDLQRISENEKIRVHIPLHFINEDTSAAVKGGGLVSRLLVEVEVSCLPKDLPEFIEVDLASIELGESVYLSQLQLPQGVEIEQITHDPTQDQPIVSIHLPRAPSELEEEQEKAEEEGGE